MGFKEWIVNEAGFLDKVGQFFSSKISDDQIRDAAKNFIRYLREHHALQWNNDQRAYRLLINMVKSFAQEIIIPPNDLIYLANSINQVNQHHITPEELLTYYWQAHQMYPKLFPFPSGVKDPKVTPMGLNAAWVKSQSESEPESVVKPYLNKKENYSNLVNDFKSRSGFIAKTDRDNQLLETLFKILLHGTDGPWESILRRIYNIYRTNLPIGQNEASAVEFVENLVHWYHIKNYRAILDEAKKIDNEIKNSGPQPPPPNPNSKNTLTPDEERTLQTCIGDFPKHRIDPKVPKTTLLTVDDFKKFKKGSPEWDMVVNFVYRTKKNSVLLRKFADIIQKL